MLLVAIFVLGYLAIVFEHPLKLNKSASAMLTGVLCWTAYVVGGDRERIAEELQHHLGGVSGILFFLLGAMTIVELVDAHDGFEIVTARITSGSRRKLLATIALLTFFLSAVLDNLTTSIVMMSLVRKLVADDRDRMLYGGVVIIAANAGGAWSPIGDVTTTMLWAGGNITTLTVVRKLILPSLVSLAVPAIWLGVRMPGTIARPRAGEDGALKRWLDDTAAALPADDAERTSIALPAGAAATGKSLAEVNLRARTGVWVYSITRSGTVLTDPSPSVLLEAGDILELGGPPEAVGRALAVLVLNEVQRPTSTAERTIVFFTGLGALVFVPVFKTLTHLPPVMGILLGLGVLWTVTEIIHKRKNDEGRNALSVAGALQRIDAPSVLFFLGILLAVTALESAGLLPALARWVDRSVGNIALVDFTIGIASSVIDNVPLVAASQGMYPTSTFPPDHAFWIFLAYCAGTGGSILIIGSAAGIAVMGIQRITFRWYVQHITFPALLGYAAGAATYLVMERLTG